MSKKRKREDADGDAGEETREDMLRVHLCDDLVRVVLEYVPSAATDEQRIEDHKVVIERLFEACGRFEDYDNIERRDADFWDEALNSLDGFCDMCYLRDALCECHKPAKRARHEEQRQEAQRKIVFRFFRD
jgi:hypothetical protein